MSESERRERAVQAVAGIVHEFGNYETVERMSEELGVDELRSAAVERLLAPELTGVALPLVQGIVRHLGLESERPRVEAVLCDPAQPRAVRARMADLVAFFGLDE